MVRVAHAINNNIIERNITDNLGFILSNRKGGYLSLFENRSSRYEGLFIYDNNKMYKILDDIFPTNQAKITKIKNNFYNIERTRDNRQKESLFVPFGYDALVYELNYPEEIELSFDIRQSYDNREWGRTYSISEEDKIIIIKYTKKTDDREDSIPGVVEFTYYVAVIPDRLDYHQLSEWKKQFYELDKKRNSHPSEKYVFSALRLTVKQIIISASKDKKQAIQKARSIKKNLTRLGSSQKKYYESVLKPLRLRSIKENTTLFFKYPNIAMAYKSAINNLDNLLIHKKNKFNIFAGLPWFFQFWTRDEGVSLGAFIKHKEYDVVKQIIGRQLSMIQPDGRIPNILDKKSLGCADNIGWLAKRTLDLIEGLKKENKLKLYFSKKDFNYLTERLEHACYLLIKYHTKRNLVKNGPQETWMDTVHKGDDRKGERIEIQAMQLCLYRLLYILTGKEDYKNLELELKDTVRKNFFKDNILYDGVGDNTIRPNIFIAAYIYPDLLTKKEWITCFNNILPNLWLTWGGLTTIDKGNRLFTDTCTGEDVKSYHRGDSWFWINNLAAMVLYKTDAKRFDRYIQKILDASTKEILYQGAIGNHSELSSANKLSSEGCFSQAWSAAIYIELVDEMFLR